MTDLHQQTMDRAYNRWQEHDKANPTEAWRKSQFFAQLTPQEKFAVATGNLCCQVQNGGFQQWFDNGYGSADTIAFLVEALARVDTVTCTCVRIMLELAKRTKSRRMLDDLDDVFYKIDDQFLADCEAYLQKGGA